VEPLSAPEPAHLELLRPQLGRDPAVGEHRPLPAFADKGDDDSVPPLDSRPDDLDAVARELLDCQLAGGICRALADEAGRCAELRGPRRDVRGLAAGAEVGLGTRLGVRFGRALRAHDDVEEQVTEANEGEGHA
jgi:hypothetical protein